MAGVVKGMDATLKSMNLEKVQQSTCGYNVISKKEPIKTHRQCLF